jgi:hypothetical protein
VCVRVVSVCVVLCQSQKKKRDMILKTKIGSSEKSEYFHDKNPFLKVLGFFFNMQANFVIEQHNALVRLGGVFLCSTLVEVSNTDPHSSSLMAFFNWRNTIFCTPRTRGENYSTS